MFQFPLLLAQESAAVITTDEWSNTFFGLGQEQRFVLLLLALLGVIAIVIVLPIIIATAYSGMHRRQAEMELKQEMLDRGMSAEEIAEVIEATPISDFADRWVKGKFNNKKRQV